MKSLLKITACVFAVSAAAAFAGDDRMKGEKIEVSALPAAVTEAVSEKWADSQISSAYTTKMGDELCYKVKVERDGKTEVAYVHSTGEIMEMKDMDKDTAKDQDMD